MTISFSQSVVTDRLQALTRALDKDATNPGQIRIYSGARPAAGATVGSGNTLLAAINFQKPSSGGVANNVLTLNYVGGAVLAVGTGVATWARFVDGAAGYVADMDVSDSTGHAEVQLDNTQVYAGGSVTVTGVASLAEQ